MKIFTISELNLAIKSLIEPPFSNITVKAEISNFKLQSSGHLYFSLKDAQSQIGAVMFKGNAATLPRMPKEGDQVVARGELSVYQPRGQYQIVVREIEFQGVGALLLKLQQLKEQMQLKGWFDPKLKKAIPKFPKTIGIVTSPTGAVIQDILNILKRRFSGFHLVLNPVKVQGEGAAQEIAQAIYDFNKYKLADLLIVGRGGGSIEDLWAFNEEIVAKAIFESEIPVISAVGHETDFTIADFVADIRAPTPSAAAEIATQEKGNLIKYLSYVEQVCKQRIQQQLFQYKQRIVALKKHPLLSSPYGILSQAIQKLDEFERRLELVSPIHKIERYREKLKRIRENLQSLHPDNILKKGYCILFQEKENSIILSSKQVSLQQNLVVQMHDGKVGVTVRGI